MINSSPSIDQVLNKFRSQMCLACSDIKLTKFNEIETLCINSNTSHFMCSKCRLRYFHVRSQRLCKCRRPFTEAEIKLLTEELIKTCCICFDSKEKSRHCDCCKSIICKKCSRSLKDLRSCVPCSEKRCSRCENLLGTRYTFENEFFIHIRCLRK